MNFGDKRKWRQNAQGAPSLIPGTHLKVKSINAKNIGLYKPIKRGSFQKNPLYHQRGKSWKLGRR